MHDPIRMYVHEMEKRLKAAIPIMSEKIIDKMLNIYKDCVDEFYLDYDPIKYNRGLYTYAGIGDGGWYTYNVSNKGKYGKHYTITFNVETDSGNLGEPYDDSAEYVFSRTWLQGIHGSLRVKKVMTPTPHELMETKLKEFENDGTYLRFVNQAMIATGFKGTFVN